MKFLVIALCILATTSARKLHHEKGCTREENEGNIVSLDGSEKTQYHHFDRAAFIHSMDPKDVNDACTVDGKDNFGFDSDKVTVWAGNGCKGSFIVDYLVAHCTNVTLNSKNADQYTDETIKSPCYKSGASYDMKKIQEYSVGKCGDYDGEHTGIGNHYGFAVRTVWTDNGCDGLFQICEVGIKMDEEDDH